jgi:small nuclear ribonucleoprotein
MEAASSIGNNKLKIVMVSSGTSVFSLQLQKPLNVLNQAINKQVMVELKGNREYRGVLDGYDPHMNLVLKNAEEWINGNIIRKLSITIVRGDNVIFISP